MFYLIDNEIREISFGETDPGKTVVGYIGVEELKEIGEQLGFSQSAIDACSVESTLFRTDVEVHQDYTYTQMRILSENRSDDCVALFLKSNLLLVVNVSDPDSSVIKTLESAVRRIPANKANAVRLVCGFIESLISGDSKNIEIIRNELTEMEESVIKGDAGNEFNIHLLSLKKKLLKLHNYYEQILDIAEAIEENDNDIFEEDQLIYATNLITKVSRLRDNTDSLRNASDHLQDAYSSSLEMKLNHTMKIFTVITTIFFPLTIIVGWYGMNFSSMPEFAWKYGYVYVTALSVITVTALVLLGKKKKWF